MSVITQTEFSIELTLKTHTKREEEHFKCAEGFSESSDVKPLICEVCGGTFSDSSALETHAETHAETHTNVKSHICEVCG